MADPYPSHHLPARACSALHRGRKRSLRLRSALLMFLSSWIIPVALGQCNQGFTFTASPPPVGGEYTSGQAVTFCYTVTNWNIVNVNWFHGIGLSFGAGWDQSTLTPGPPPATCGASGGTWGWYNVCDGTSPTAVGPVGPGFFFDLDNDGDPGNNFGDLCSGAVNWQFCFTISVASGAACVDGANLGVTVNSYGDSESGSWGSLGCQNDPVPTLPATTNCCDADAGTNGAANVCETSAPVNLTALLGGTPDAGGTWSAPGGGASPAVIDPATATAGNYTYTVTSGGCSSSAIVAVTIQQIVNAGSNGSSVVCADGLPFDLFALLGGGPDTGGSWTAPGGGGASNTYTPGSSTPGTYTYTVVANAPCPNDQATVTITENTPVNAGLDGLISVCANSAPVDLFAQLGGGPEAGGSWAAPGGGATSSMYTPGSSLPGIYIYTVVAVAPCQNAQASVTVAENAPVNAGTNGAASVCADGGDLDLFGLLGGAPDLGGTWTSPGGGGSTGVFTAGVSTAGAYTYTVPGQAPCPDDLATVTISQSDPVDAGTPGSTTVCADGAPIDLFTLLGGTPDATGTWTAPGGGATINTYSPGTSTSGIYTYTVVAVAPCPDMTTTVTVAENGVVDAGTDGSSTTCSDGAALDLFSLLGGSPGTGGAWTAPGGGPTSSTYSPGVSTAGTYTYTLTAVAPCVDDQSTVTITENAPVNAGTDGALTVCADGIGIDLFTLLGGAPDVGGSWTAPGGGNVPSLYQPGVSIPGVYTYSLVALTPCADDQSTVTITQNAPVSAGTDGTITVCANGPAVDLFALLGTADPGGAWIAPGGGGATSTYVPGSDIPGVYTYAVTALSPCADDQATITVTQNDPVDAGTDAPLTVCADGAAVGLFGLLGGSAEAGGSWSAPGGGLATGLYTPGTSLPGTYTYLVTAAAPCVNDQASVTVTENLPVNAGTDGAVTTCADGAPLDLFLVLGGSPDGGGSWTAPGGGASSNTYDPGTSAPGIYTYSITALAPCANDQSTVTVTQNVPPDAGQDGAITLCISSPATSLFAELGGSPDGGGTWTAPSGASASGVFTPGVDPTGVYTYTVQGSAPCSASSASVTVAVVSLPDPGTNGAITLCTNGPIQDLFAVLGGSPDAGGDWTAPGGAPHSGSVDPLSDAPGIYTYTIDVPAPCVSVSSTVNVSFQTPPDAGTDAAELFCITSLAAALINSLGANADPGGVWTAPDGGPFSGTFTPGVDAPGVHTYTVAGIAPCASVSATVDVTVTTLPDAGTPGAVTLCTNGSTTDLFASLNGTPDAGGIWNAPGGAAHTGLFDPTTEVAGVYTYTIAAPAPCLSVSSSVTVSLQTPPDPGLDGAVLLCVTSPTVNLFSYLEGTPHPTGTWTAPGGGAFNGNFTPGTSAPGTYTYTVLGLTPCANASATVDVAVTALPDAGSNGVLALCTTDAGTDLFSMLGGAPDVGGTWSAPGGSAHTGILDPSADVAGNYTYTVAAPAPCTSVSATVSVSVQAPPDAGMDGALTLCITGGPLALATALGGTPDAGGSWTDPGGSSFPGVFIPGTTPAGIFTYTVPGIAPCPAASAQVSVVVTTEPDPGINGAVVLCANSLGTDLFTSLGGTPDAGGAWTTPAGTAHSGFLDPATDAAGVYTYTISVPLPCSGASSTVTVFLQAPPDPGLPASLSVCTSGGVLDLFQSLNGTPSSGGSWTTPGGAPSSDLLDPATAVSGEYTYTVTGTAPCPNATSTVDVTLVSPPDPGGDGAITLCATDPSTPLQTLLGGSPDAGGTWTAPDGSSHAGTVEPAVDAPGIYTYTVVGNSPCPSASSEVLLALNAPPDAGTNTSVTLCSTNAPIDLYSALGGAPAANGNWTSPFGNGVDPAYDPGVDPSGDYTYTVIGTAPCPSASATVTMNVVQAPDAGSDGAVLLCSASPVTDLFPHLVGSPESGGSWSTPGGGASTGLFDPATDTPGMFTYHVTGTAPCMDASAQVLVNVTSNPDAGLPGDHTLCASDPVVSLLSELNGTPDAGGTWTSPDGSPHPDTFDPSTDAPGLYTYTIDVPPPCVPASSSVTVNIVAPADAGADGSLILCSSSVPQELLPQLDGSPETDGTWSFNGDPHTGTFDPATDLPGSYVYSVSGAAPCPLVTAQVSVAVNAPPDAGLDGSVDLCSSGDPADLLSVLNGTPDVGGVWSFAGSAHSTMVDPGVDLAGDYTYTVAGLSPCPSASATATVTLITPPDPGTDGVTTLCLTDGSIELIAQLTGSPEAGGVWTGPSAVLDDTFDPANMVAGTYVYTLSGTAPCPDVSSQVDVQLVTPPDPGISSSIALCITSPATDLFSALEGTPQPGGSWTAPDGLPHSLLFNPAVDAPGDYTYSVNGTAPCAGNSATVTVNVVTNPDPGISEGTTLCANGAGVDLFSQLGGSPDIGGTWTGPSPVMGGSYEPTTMLAGTYTYTIDVPAPCVSVSSSVTVALVAPPEAGLDGSALLCITSPDVALTAFLGGATEIGGSWTDPNGSPFSGDLDADVHPEGIYTYTVNGAWPCAADQSTVLVSVVEKPYPGEDGALTLCQSDGPADLLNFLEGTPDLGGTWAGPSTIADGSFDPAMMLGGTYTYTLDAPEPCNDASSVVVVTVVAPPDAGDDGSIITCGNAIAFDMFALLLNGPSAGGTWTDPADEVHSGIFTPGADVAGVYTYTLPGAWPCPADIAIVTVSVMTPPNAGLDSALTLCPDGSPIMLFAQLGGAPDAGGSWTQPGGGTSSGVMDPMLDPAGAYTYSVTGIAPCPDAFAQVLISISAPVLGTVATTDAICHDACDGTALLSITGGTPDFTMQWTAAAAGPSDLLADGLCAGNFSVAITDANGCTGSADFVIGEPVPLVIDAIGVGDENCIGSCDGYLNIVDGEGVNFSVDGGATWSANSQITDLCAGGYIVLMQDANGCLASTTASVSSPPPVVAAFTPVQDTVSVSNTVIDFLNQSGYAESFVWDFGGLTTSTEGNPSFAFPDVLGGVYTVCLTATNSNGCTDSVCQPIVVLDELFVTVPNAFTPDGNGVNDVFAPVFNVPAFAEDYSFAVFDRWGLGLFTSETIGETWDGSLNGTTVQQDVYVWKVHCRDRITKEVHDLIGHVTVLR